MRGEYAAAGVDYRQIEPFKREMINAGKQTLKYPNSRNVVICEDVMHAHGAVYEYLGNRRHRWSKTQEGLGNLNWIAEWMYAYSGTGRTYYEVIARAAALIIAIDVIAQGAMPVVWTDEVAAGDSDWFADPKRTLDYARGCVDVCRELHMALPAGESPSLKYLVNAKLPVKSAPVLSGSITGLIVPKQRLITGQKLRAGDIIVGAPSFGLGANGISAVIGRVLGDPDRGIKPLKDEFCAQLPNGRMLGEECLRPMHSYVALVEALIEREVDIHAILPATGDGVGKLSFDHRPFTYRITDWVEVPILFLYLQQIGISLMDCLKTFNWGIGIYLFLPALEVEGAISIAADAGYDLRVLGRVENGKRQTIFGPEGDLVLPPPGE